MNDYESAELESDCIADRTRRALERPLSVVTPRGTPVTDPETSVVSVVSGNTGRTHTVDVREARCTCEDSEYRDPEGGCYHVRRARFALGRSSIPADVLAAVDVDQTLGANAPGPVVATADGGIVRPDEGAEVLEGDSAGGDPWEGPHTEYDKYGQPTGAEYLRCRDCGVEVVTSVDTETVAHRDGCRFGDD
jgi:hypothetical protein